MDPCDRPESAARALEELARYALERRTVRARPPLIVAFPGAASAGAVFVVVLVTTAIARASRRSARIGLRRDPWTRGWGRWRVVARNHALTLHLDQAHLLGNLLFGAVFGTLAGGAFGPGVAWSSILAAGAVADYLDMLISPPEHRAAGASTAVFAALGLLSGFSWRLRLSLREQFRYRWHRCSAGCFCSPCWVRARSGWTFSGTRSVRGGPRPRLDLRAAGCPPNPRSPPAMVGRGGRARVIVGAWFLALHR